MNNYTLHFIVSLIFSLVVISVFGKRLKLKRLVSGFVLVPLVSYIVFYDYNLSLIQSSLTHLIGYLGSTFFCCLYFFFLSFRHSNQIRGEKPCLWFVVLFAILQGLEIILIRVIPWGVDTFPLSNIDAVLFTLFVPVDGSEEFVVKTFFEKVIWPSVVLWVTCIFAEISIAVLLVPKKIVGYFDLFGCKVSFNCTKCFFSAYDVMKITTFVLCFISVIYLSIVSTILDSPAFHAVFEKEIDSDFYKKNYVNPDNAIFFENKKQKNLIVFFLESMTNNFSEYTPELNEVKKSGWSFDPGAESVSGTNWTIAGMTAALCGLPLNMPMGINEYLGKLPTYLPNAECVSDLFAKKGYKQIAIQGSSADFTQIRQFWKSHGSVDIRDNDYMKKIGMVPKNYSVFWGVEDRYVYELLRQNLDSLSKGETPFSVYVSTIDTHQPNGFVDSSCHFEEISQYKNALRCSSYQFGRFMDWAKKQEWFDNTVIWIVGDHSIQELATKAGLSSNEKLYTTAIVLNTDIELKKKERRFTNLDYAASILETMGWTLEMHSFALGKSLFSNESTVLEIYGRDSLDVLLRQRSKQYNYFLYGK